MGGAKDASAEKEQYASPVLQGATNGVMTPLDGFASGGSDKLVQGKNLRLEASPYDNQSAAAPSIAGGKVNEADESSKPEADANGNFIDANGDTVDADGKPVPEADTWMLLSLLALMFAGSWFASKKRKAQSI